MAATESLLAPTPDHLPTPASGGSSAKRTWLGLALSALSAVLLFVMCDGHMGLWPLVIVAFVPMYVAQYRLLPRRLSGLAVGIAFFGYWFSLWMYSFSLSQYIGGPVIGMAVIIVLAAVMGVPFWLLGTLERPFAERTNYKWFVVQLPILWVGIEVAFGANPFFGSNYWLAYRMAPVPFLDQPVSILSTPALSFLLVMINAGIALLVLKWMDRRWPRLATVAIPNRTVRWSSTVVLVLVVVWVASSLVINWQVNRQLGPVVKVAAAQSGNANRTPDTEEAQDSVQEAARNIKLQEQMTRMTKSAAAQGVQLVVWPEWILEYDATGPKGAWVGALAKETNTTIVAGYIPDAPHATSPNMGAVWLPNGELAGSPYFKIHPVVLEGEQFKTPKDYPTYDTSFGQLGVIICYDHDFPDDSSRLITLAGAQIIAVPALDPASISHLRWQSLAFRAIENRVPFVKTDIGFDSAIINANGVVATRVETTDKHGAEELLIAEVNLGPRNAPFSAIGGYTFGILVLLALLARYIYHWRLAHPRTGRPAQSTS